MGKTIYIQDDGHMDFESISDFKRSLSWGMEAQFQWGGKTYGIAHDLPEDRIVVYEAKKPETERVFKTADEALEFMVGADRLRDIITKVHVVERTI